MAWAQPRGSSAAWDLGWAVVTGGSVEPQRLRCQLCRCLSRERSWAVTLVPVRAASPCGLGSVSTVAGIQGVVVGEAGSGRYQSFEVLGLQFLARCFRHILGVKGSPEAGGRGKLRLLLRGRRVCEEGGNCGGHLWRLVPPQLTEHLP